jgi:2-haloalkanoic acid dehalogenase type II
MHVQPAMGHLSPRLFSFDVFGTLFDVRQGTYDAFQSILTDAFASHVDVKVFWEYWEHRNIVHYWEPYRRYRDICELSLSEAFAHFGVRGNAKLIGRYFDSFPSLPFYPDVDRTLDALSGRGRLAVVSNIDDDLLALTPLKSGFDLLCTAEKAHGYKPDGTLFRYLIARAGVPKEAILHSGQSQFTDLVGAKPLGLTIAWINRRGVPLDASVPRPDFELSAIEGLFNLLTPQPEVTS